MPETATDTSVSATDLRLLIAEGADVRMLDVRTPGEFDAGHIPGAVNVPLDRVRGRAAEFGDGKGLVLICRSGARAETARTHLTGVGVAGARVLTGGVDAWAAGGGETTSAGTGRWNLERQVRLVAGALVLIGIVVSVAWSPARYFSGMIGAGLMFAAITNTCAMGMALGKLPYNRGRSCDIDNAVSQLRR